MLNLRLVRRIEGVVELSISDHRKVIAIGFPGNQEVLWYTDLIYLSQSRKRGFEFLRNPQELELQKRF
jgi:hypothetical protein